MKLKLSAIVLLAMLTSAQVPAATLTDAEATFLDQLVTAAMVLAQRCTGYEVNGTGGVQLGARQLGSPDAAMAMIAAFDAAGKTSSRVLGALMKNPKAACADYGEAGVEHGLLRRY